MKDFEEFKSYIKENGQAVHEEIVEKVNLADEKIDDDDLFSMEHHMRAWAENSAYVMLEHYHKWLNS